MGEYADIKALRKRLTEIFVNFKNDQPFFRREDVKRTTNKEQWETKRNDLTERIRSEQKIPPEAESTPLMLLSALDQALVNIGERGSTQPIQIQVNNRDWFLVKRPVALGTRTHTEQSMHLHNWLNNHLIVPKIFNPDKSAPNNDQSDFKVKIIIARDDDDVRMRLKNNSLRVWFGTFPDNINPHWPEFNDQKCTCKNLENPCLRRKSIQKSLNDAQTAQAQVVILPELAVCPTLQEEIRLHLKNKEFNFLIVVPGSFHEWNKELPDELPFNRTRLLNGEGRQIFTHDKFNPFGSEDKKSCHEVISIGNTVTLWITPIGVISLAICRDFCEEDDDSDPRLWKTVAPDLVLVPSMSPRGGMTAHLRQAQFLYNSCGARVLVANQWPKQPYPEKGSCNKNDCTETDCETANCSERYLMHGFAFPLPDGKAGAQEVTNSSEGRLKLLQLP
ncbi:MAG: hypothetical protein HQL93_00630 [Magnetococcales bacterium]|nr:hypothetical protein [Magnetococcales bacterium]